MSSRRRGFLAPEVIQISLMDCGPAALKCLLNAASVQVRYEALRDLCQTEVDGTSIDAMQDVATQLGAPARQIIVPIENVVSPGSSMVPSILVMAVPNGGTHFVVLWRQHRRLIQAMDPAAGRLWMRTRDLVETAFRHTMVMPLEWWLDLAFDQDTFVHPVRRRLQEIGGPDPDGGLVDMACTDPSGAAMADLDAALRMTEAIVQSRAVPRGPAARKVIERLLSDPSQIPPSYYFVRPDPSDETQVRATGAVILVVEPDGQAAVADDDAPRPLSAAAAELVKGDELRPVAELLRVVKQDGVGPLVAAGLLAVMGALMVVLQALVFRSLIDVWSSLTVTEQRLQAAGAAVGLLLLMYLSQLALYRIGHRIGRHAEVRLRVELLDKLARLGDRYFRSRTLSDLADRAHRAHEVELIPVLFLEVAYAATQLVAIVVFLGVIDPATLPLAITMVVVVCAVPISLRRALEEAKLRAARHSATLGRYFLDSLLGAVALRAHGGARAMRREHEEQLGEWALASLKHQRFAIASESLQLLLGFALASWLILAHFGRTGDRGGLLIVVFWAFQIPLLGQQITLAAKLYPALRASLVRLLEPLHSLEQEQRRPLELVEPGPGPEEELPAEVFEPPAPEEDEVSAVSDADGDDRGEITQIVDLFAVPRPGEPSARPDAEQAPPTGVRIAFEDVWLRLSGTTLLRAVRLDVAPGEQVAIVGASGAGKSSLLAMLLGIYRPSGGRVLVDGEELVDPWLDRIRQTTAWVDPQVRLWNRSMATNLQYGCAVSPDRLGWMVRASDLLPCMERLPSGLQTSLGEGGQRLSGGEGQRVRFGRGLGRPAAGLVLLDEPFRGLDRDHRRALTARARACWEGATLLCVSHDVSETREFHRVVVVSDGRVVEDGPPEELLARESLYRTMYLSDRRMGDEVWSAEQWRRLEVRSGQAGWVEE